LWKVSLEETPPRPEEVEAGGGPVLLGGGGPPCFPLEEALLVLNVDFVANVVATWGE